jgi:hypothetical protein
VPGMDPNVVALLVAGVGIAGTLAGVVVADLLAGRREKANRVRERGLASLQQTKQLVHAHLLDALAVAAGAPSSRIYGSDVYPLAAPLLIGDAAALKAYLRVGIDLLRHPKGEPARESQARAVASAFSEVDSAIAKQEARLLDDQPSRQLSRAELQELEPLLVEMGMA